MARTHKATKAKAVKGAARNWIAGAVGKNVGGLHRALGIPLGQKIPASKKTPKKGDSPKLRKQKILARTLAGFH
jgi:hypothetical protein